MPYAPYIMHRPMPYARLHSPRRAPFVTNLLANETGRAS